MPIGRKNQGEGDDNDMHGEIQHSKDRRVKDSRQENRRNKLAQTSRKATNKDGKGGRR